MSGDEAKTPISNRLLRYRGGIDVLNKRQIVQGVAPGSGLRAASGLAASAGDFEAEQNGERRLSRHAPETWRRRSAEPRSRTGRADRRGDDATGVTPHGDLDQQTGSHTISLGAEMVGPAIKGDAFSAEEDEAILANPSSGSDVLSAGRLLHLRRLEALRLRRP
jgi:hypothetical protein